ncbi:MAG TPA: ATP-binding protein [Polyangiaceae bacterium]|nr:ATP-binding protein [Polyangiaceae bacterium]
MVIAGPNGVGKSTLLFAIKQRTGGDIAMHGKVLYLSPHRIWRRQNVQMMHLLDRTPRFSDMLTQDSVSGFGSFQVFNASRAPDSADESFGAIKHALSQFETRKQTAVNALLKKRGSVTLADIGNVYGPLQELTKFLLPHLRFLEIDLTQRSNIRVVFTRTDKSGSIPVEMDDLSSGERSLISLFMPFLETEIEAHLARIEGAPDDQSPREDTVVLIDEPEIHLHPYLQARMVEYLRSITARGGVQFVLATHSTTIIDAADYDELFVLNPPSATTPDDNQLVQLATSAEKLSAIRTLTGETHTLTLGRKLLCIEGELPSGNRNHATDVRLLELMCPEVTTYVILPFGGKSTTLDAASRLRSLLSEAFGLEAVLALVDKDTSDRPREPWIHHLPVTMVENLLLQPAVIWDILQPHKERLQFSDAAGVEAELRVIAKARRDLEVRLRVNRKIPFIRFRPQGLTPTELQGSFDAQAATSRGSLPQDDELASLVREAEEAVDAALSNAEELDLFHGKDILQAFHKGHVEQLAIAYHPFCLQLARAVGRDENGRKHVAKHLASILPPPEPAVNVPSTASPSSGSDLPPAAWTG